MRFLQIFILISLFGIYSCGSEKKSDAKEKTEEKKDLQDPELQKMMDQLGDDNEENLPDGFHEIKYPSGKLKSSGTISNGKKEGMWTYFHEDGRKWSECNFQAGLSHGKVVSFHPNGQVNYIGYFVGGNKTGMWMFYDMEGKLIKEVDMSKSKSAKAK